MVLQLLFQELSLTMVASPYEHHPLPLSLIKESVETAALAISSQTQHIPGKKGSGSPILPLSRRKSESQRELQETHPKTSATCHLAWPNLPPSPPTPTSGRKLANGITEDQVALRRHQSMLLNEGTFGWE